MCFKRVFRYPMASQKRADESSDSDNNDETVRHNRIQSSVHNPGDNGDEDCVTFADGKRQIGIINMNVILFNTNYKLFK